MIAVRPPAVAGSFYPAAAPELAHLVRTMLARAPSYAGPCPKALIVPHAGYVYSGEIAAAAFARIAPHAAQLERVVVIGPAHRVAFEGVAWPGAARLATPLGELEVDVEAISAVPELRADPDAHAREHALEVELPFLQVIAPHVKIVPLVASRASADLVGRVLDALWGGPETLIVLSSDLSHYLPYLVGRARDERTVARIVARDPTLTGDDACGAVAINGLLWLARRRPLALELVDLRSSGDTAGSRDEVVGYAALACQEAAS